MAVSCLWLQVSKTLLFRRLPQPPFVVDTLSCFCILDTTRSRVPLAYTFITFLFINYDRSFFIFISFFSPEALTIKAIFARFALGVYFGYHQYAITASLP